MPPPDPAAADPPSELYLDTGYVLAALIGGLPHSVAAEAFARRLIDAGSRVCFSQLLRLEIAHALRGLARDSRRNLPAPIRQQFGLDRWDHDSAVRRTWLRFGLRQLDAFLGFFEAAEFPCLDSTWWRSIPIMAKHGLGSYDAIHVATAREHKIGDLATTDRGFTSIRSPRIWLVRDTAR